MMMIKRKMGYLDRRGLLWPDCIRLRSSYASTSVTLILENKRREERSPVWPALMISGGGGGSGGSRCYSGCCSLTYSGFVAS